MTFFIAEVDASSNLRHDSSCPPNKLSSDQAIYVALLQSHFRHSTLKFNNVPISLPRDIKLRIHQV